MSNNIAISQKPYVPLLDHVPLKEEVSLLDRVQMTPKLQAKLEKSRQKLVELALCPCPKKDSPAHYVAFPPQEPLPPRKPFPPRSNKS